MLVSWAGVVSVPRDHSAVKPASWAGVVSVPGKHSAVKPALDGQDALYAASRSSRVGACLAGARASPLFCTLIPNGAERGVIWNRATATAGFLVIPGEITLATFAHGALPRAARRPWGARRVPLVIRHACAIGVPRENTMSRALSAAARARVAGPTIRGRSAAGAPWTSRGERSSGGASSSG